MSSWVKIVSKNNMDGPVKPLSPEQLELNEFKEILKSGNFKLAFEKMQD